MKTQIICQTVRLFTLSLSILFLTNSCNISGQNSKSDSKSNNQSVLTKPTISIHSAVISGNLEVVKQHIKSKTDINAKEAMSGSTPLITAATFGETHIVKVLIDAGADLTLTNNDGATALHTSAFFCHIEIVQLLLDAKADKNIRNNFGATPRESVMGPFVEIKPIYEMLQQQLAPIGLKINMNEIEKTRPVIAMMLQ